MSEWQNKSDFEINLAVAKLMPPIISENQSASLKSRSSSVLVNDIVNEWEFNPCNSASDAYPIIFDKKISLSWTGTYWSVIPPFLSGTAGQREDKNPLRAAMIVFLDLIGANHYDR